MKREELLCPNECLNKDKECHTCVDGSNFKINTEIKLQVHEKYFVEYFVDDNMLYNKMEEKVIKSDGNV